MKDPVETDITQSLAFRLHQAAVLVDRAADRFLRSRFEISYSLFSVLLIAATRREPSQRQIADALGVSRASITHRIAELSGRGLVRAVPDEDDARAARVVVTEPGRTLLTAAWTAMESEDDGIDQGVDVDALRRELEILIANATAYLGRLGEEPTR